MGDRMTLPKHRPSQLIKIHKTENEHLGYFMYYEQSKNRWKFHGYYCLYCNKVFTRELRANNHLSVCKEYNRKPTYMVDTFDTILDKFGRPWNPVV